MSLELSVCIATAGPDCELFGEVLDALKEQTLAPSCYEIVVIDNASADPVRERWREALRWHPAVVFESEPRRGHAHARRKALDAARAPIVVFVDDDCVLAEDYLERALETMAERSGLGTLGGSIRFEAVGGSPLARAMHDARFGRRELQGFVETRSHTGYVAEAFHGGAGMVVRRNACQVYLERYWVYDALERAIGPSRSSPMLFEDLDISMGALHRGFSIGRSGELRLVHKTPRTRMTTRRFLRASYHHGFQWELFRMRWNWRRYENSLVNEYRGLLVQTLRRGRSLSTWLTGSTLAAGVTRARVLLTKHPELVRRFAYGPADCQRMDL